MSPNAYPKFWELPYNQTMNNASSKLDALKGHLKPGKVYRREDFACYTKSIDRHVRQLIVEGLLKKAARGIYYCPKKASFGDVPPDDEKLIRAFLKNDNFYIASLNAYNALGVGATQLYNEKLVYNHKRAGRFTLDGRVFHFLKRSRFPKNSSPEFLLVDLMNNFEFLAEDQQTLRRNVAKKALSMNRRKLMNAVHDYAGAKARKFFEIVLLAD
jgi:hypothetical protein